MVAAQPAKTQAKDSSSVKIKSLLVRVPRAELVRELGVAEISDSMVDVVKAGEETTILFEPATFEGARALIEATFLRDTTTKIEVYLPYIGHPDTRLKVPFEMGDFVKGTLEDYNQIERTIEDELGIPTVLTGTTFEYLEGNTQPIFGVFENGITTITIVPVQPPPTRQLEKAGEQNKE